ncbi:hypothetical protein [Pseudonocardia sp. N23]|uniref:hypothetical protein n=1 Tax=Pseudonocardia sp. N23 TaxID=1987376 RepID=UPI000C02ABAB|nr:hypothetical protein [Pseudonocardia sp. N23]GAY07499.1 hypothetical protein TOK_3519 [Pseudonocardia sp. N23]
MSILLRTLPPDESAALQQMLDDAGWSASAIHDAVTAEGYSVGRQTITKHRRSACRCRRSSPYLRPTSP